MATDSHHLAPRCRLAVELELLPPISHAAMDPDKVLATLADQVRAVRRFLKSHYGTGVPDYHDILADLKQLKADVLSAKSDCKRRKEAGEDVAEEVPHKERQFETRFADLRKMSQTNVTIVRSEVGLQLK